MTGADSISPGRAMRRADQAGARHFLYFIIQDSRGSAKVGRITVLRKAALRAREPGRDYLPGEPWMAASCPCDEQNDWIVTVGIVLSSDLPVARVRAAVDVQSLAGHERGRLQIQYRLNHLTDLAHPPHRV
jgi:hypothetical protein